MTENRNNIHTPLKRIREEMQTLESDSLRAFKMLQWLKENMDRLQDWQEAIDEVTEQRHIKEMGVRDKTNSRPNIVHSINRYKKY